MKSVRELIFDYLQKGYSASAAELSLSLHVTRADIRYHLKQLLEDRVIEKSVIVRPEYKGRPTQLYRLSRRAQPENYMQLSEALLSISEESNANVKIFDQLAAFMAGKIPNAKHRATQLNRLISALNEHEYEASWEAYVNGPRIIIKNCPYAALLPEHPELCAMDRKIIENYLGARFNQAAKIEQKTRKSPASCVFMLETRDEVH